MSSAAPPLRVFEKIASTCCSVRRLERVVLVHVDREHVDRGAHAGRLVAVLGLELVDLLVLHLAAHGAEGRRARDQRRRRGRRALAFDLDLDVGIRLAEIFRPQRHQVVHRVRADCS